ncbi:MAG: hypothetical protein WDO73_37000 [Ignavibacteriota bacterium]
MLYSLNKNDGRILTTAQMQEMEATPLGWDTKQDSTGYRWVEKNGGWGANGNDDQHVDRTVRSRGCSGRCS